MQDIENTKKFHLRYAYDFLLLFSEGLVFTRD